MAARRAQLAPGSLYPHPKPGETDPKHPAADESARRTLRDMIMTTSSAAVKHRRPPIHIIDTECEALTALALRVEDA